MQGTIEIALGSVPAHFRVGIVERVMFGTNLIVEILVAGSFRTGGIGSLPVQFQHQGQLGEGIADFSLLPGIHGSIVQLPFFLAQPVVFLFLAVHFAQQLHGARFRGPQLQHILQTFAGVKVGVIVDVLLCETVPVLDLPFTAPALDLALQAHGRCVARLQLQNFLNLLQGQRILIFLEAGLCAAQQLRHRFLPNRPVQLPPQRCKRSIDVALCFQSRQQLAGVLMIAFLQSLRRAFEPGTQLGRVKKFNRLISQRFIETLAEVAGVREAMPRLLCHSLMNYATDRLIHLRIKF